MYGKKTRMRFAEELFWGETPSSGWVEAALVESKATTSPRVATLKSLLGHRPGMVSAIGHIEVVPTVANALALGDAALMRDDDGGIGTYSVEITDDSGAWRVAGAMVRRFYARAGVARTALEFEFDIAAMSAKRAGGFTPEGAAGQPFRFPGSTCSVAGETAPLKEFMLKVDNNLFSGPSRDDGEAGFLTAGWRSISGYIVLGEDRRDLMDSAPRALTVTFPGDGANLVISVPAAFCREAREVRGAISGASQQLFFDGAETASSGGVSLTVEE